MSSSTIPSDAIAMVTVGECKEIMTGCVCVLLLLFICSATLNVVNAVVLDVADVYASSVWTDL